MTREGHHVPYLWASLHDVVHLAGIQEVLELPHDPETHMEYVIFFYYVHYARSGNISFRKTLNSSPFLYFLFVCVVKFITNRKYAFFGIYLFRLSPNNHNPNQLNLKKQCIVLKDQDWQLGKGILAGN